MLFASVFLFGAASRASSSLPVQMWYSQTYRLENGLHVGNIPAIAQDADGFLWLGTDAGLVRFDGLAFVNWGTRGEPHLPDDNIGALMCARDGSLWVGFRNGMVTRIDQGGLQTYSPHDGLPGGYVNGLLEDEDGTIWTSSRAGLAIRRTDRWEAPAAELGLPTKARIYNLHKGRTGSLWVASAVGLFRRSRLGEPFEMIYRADVRDASEDGIGGMWVTDGRRGVVHLDSAGQPVARDTGLSLNASGLKLLLDSRGDLWIGTLGQGLWRTLNTPTGIRIERASGDGDFDTDVVASVFEDREGQVWAGGHTLTRFYRHDVTMITRNEGLTNNTVRAVSATRDGSIWIAAPDGLNRFAPRTAPGQPPQRLAASRSQPFALSADPVGALWVGFQDGFGMVVDDVYTDARLPPGTRLGVVTAIASNPRTGVWLCHSAARWLSRWDGKALVGFANELALANRECTTLYHDQKDQTWIGFADGTLAVHDGDRFTVYSEKDGLPAARISAIHEDAAGAVWISTSRGLSRFRQGTFATLSERNGFPSESFNALVEDASGRLWLTFASGIVSLEKAEFEKAAADPSYRVAYRLLDSSDGLRDSPTRVNAQSSARRADGTLWFTTAGGMAVVDPARPSKPLRVLPKIDRVVVNQNMPAPPLKDIRLDAGTSMLQIDYTAGSLRAASKIRFRYMLEGLDKDWVSAGARRQAFYTNLPPRRYRFLLGASTDGGQESVIEWPFEVMPAFYQTRLFYLSTVLLGVAIIATGWWMRMRVLTKQFDLVVAERARVGREIHDTVLQSLAATALQLEGIAKKIDAAPSAAKSHLLYVRRQVEQYIYEARQSILELRSPALEKRPLSDALRESGEHLVGDSDGRLEVVVTGLPRRFSSDVELQLLRIAQEAIRNAVRHGRASHIHVELAYLGDSFRMRVTDDGCGFTVAENMFVGGQGWGLLGMRERAKRLGGRFTLTSSPGKGTEIETTITSPSVGESSS